MGGRDSPTCFWAVWQNTWSDRDRVPCWWSAEPLTSRLLRRRRCRSSHEQVTAPPWQAQGQSRNSDGRPHPRRGSRSNGTINNAPLEVVVFTDLQSMLSELNLRG